MVEEEGISAEVQSEEEEREFLKEEILGLQWIRVQHHFLCSWLLIVLVLRNEIYKIYKHHPDISGEFRQLIGIVDGLMSES